MQKSSPFACAVHGSSLNSLALFLADFGSLFAAAELGEFSSSLNVTQLHKIRWLGTRNNYMNFVIYQFLCIEQETRNPSKNTIHVLIFVHAKKPQKVGIKLSKICQAIKNLASDKRSFHASLQLFTNLHLKTHENVGVVSSYLSTSWIL